MVAKQHLTFDGLAHIVAIKSLFPKGLNDSLQSAFTSLPLIERPEFLMSESPLNTSWITGFTNGDGCFSLGFQKSSTHRLGATCYPGFIITQHGRDKVLLERIATSLDCGSVSSPRADNCCYFKVTGLSIITNKIVPFFTDHRLYGAKALDFRDFHKGITIMNQGGHLTETG